MFAPARLGVCRGLPIMANARAAQLSVDDWIRAGFGILAEGGLRALKRDRLCARLGITKGGFYWRFTDIAEYRATLIARLERVARRRSPPRRDDGRHAA